jgi:hypothetical protein
MTYEETFLDLCDAEGNAPAWAIKLIFEQHSNDPSESLSDFTAHCRATSKKWENGETILDWLGY